MAYFSQGFLLHCLVTLFVGICSSGYHFPVATARPNRMEVEGVPVHRVPLRNDDLRSPYALAVTSFVDEATISSTTARSYNFLATQVWPSARTAARVLEQWFQSTNNFDYERKITLCEFGCGPGLPSLTAALHGAALVVATDVDDLALALVRQAALEQGIDDRVMTCVFDLTDIEAPSNILPQADLYIFSDVFENAAVAQGAAHVTARVLSLNDQHSSVWVFAQSDRSQREIFLRELQELFNDPNLTWSRTAMPTASYSKSGNGDFQPKSWKDRLWLCDIDETNVFYG